MIMKLLSDIFQIKMNYWNCGLFLLV